MQDVGLPGLVALTGMGFDSDLNRVLDIHVVASATVISDALPGLSRGSVSETIADDVVHL